MSKRNDNSFAHPPAFGSETPTDFFVLLDGELQDEIICLIRGLLSRKSQSSSAPDPAEQTGD